jgi:hypothetical protein
MTPDRPRRPSPTAKGPSSASPQTPNIPGRESQPGNPVEGAGDGFRDSEACCDRSTITRSERRRRAEASPRSPGPCGGGAAGDPATAGPADVRRAPRRGRSPHPKGPPPPPRNTGSPARGSQEPDARPRRHRAPCGRVISVKSDLKMMWDEPGPRADRYSPYLCTVLPARAREPAHAKTRAPQRHPANPRRPRAFASRD